MRNIAALATAAALAGCATVPSPTEGIQSIGTDTFMVSEMSGFGNVAERAGQFCASFGQRIEIDGNTTEKGLYSGSDYAVLVFRCV